MEKMFPKMQVVELDGSHWIHVDQPEGVFKNDVPSNFISVWLISGRNSCRSYRNRTGEIIRGVRESAAGGYVSACMVIRSETKGNINARTNLSTEFFGPPR